MPKASFGPSERLHSNSSIISAGQVSASRNGASSWGP